MNPCISEDAAIAATRVILEEFFVVHPDVKPEKVGGRLVAIIKAATEAALEHQRRNIGRASRN
jgi:hypothetical protein